MRKEREIRLLSNNQWDRVYRNAHRALNNYPECKGARIAINALKVGEVATDEIVDKLYIAYRTYYSLKHEPCNLPRKQKKLYRKRLSHAANVYLLTALQVDRNIPA